MRASFAVFESVYRRELPFVWAAARRLGVHPEVIDDAVQDVFLTAYRRWSDVRQDVSPRAWLYGVTRRVAFRYRRSHARTVRRKAAVARGSSIEPSHPHRERDEARDVEAVLAVLEPGRREVFVMADLLDMSGPEIAAQLEIPLNTVYSRLRLARRELEPRLRRGVGAWAGSVRKHDQPPPEQAQRTWAVLVPLLGQVPAGASGAAGLIGAWTVGRVLGVVAAVGLVTVVAVVGRPAERSVGREDRGVEAVVEAKADRGRGPGAPSSGASVAVEEATIAPGATVPAPVVAPEPAPLEPSSASSRPPARAVEPAPREPALLEPAPPLDSASSGLEDEVAVLDRAAAALRQGDAAHALQWLAEHERRFAAGRLVDVRKATRVRALCRLGRDAQARAEAAVLRRDHPRSSVAQSTPLDCAES